MEVLGRYKNGNVDTIILSDGTKIRRTVDDEFRPSYAENCDVKINNRCNMKCPWCHEGSTPDGETVDLMSVKFIDTLHPYTELALGGGNVLESPDLIPFLERLRDKKVITNITLNQQHFLKNINLVKKLSDEKLIYGIGVSLTCTSNYLIHRIKQFPNAVIHVISGLFSPNDYHVIKDNDLKILILGYKELRRGEDYIKCGKELIAARQKWLRAQLEDNMFNHFKVVSFDNLALEQLRMKEIIPKKKWDEFYSGDDGDFTFYIDLVKKQFARSSTAPLDKRYDLLDNIDDMFQVIQNEKKSENNAA